MFDLTAEGCEKATAYLTQSNQLHLLDRELSTDGYTLVALANRLFAKHVSGGEAPGTERVKGKE